MKKILVVGTGGLAREFTSWFAGSHEILGYFSTNLVEHAQFNLPGVLHSGSITPQSVGTDLVAVAIGTPSVKAAMYEQLTQLGFKFPIFTHASSTVSSLATLQDGVIVSPHCVVSPNVKLQKLAYLNFGCGVGHDAQVGSFSQINPGAQLGGFTNIGAQTLIGSGATILQGVTIGANATVASGSVVFAKIADGATVMGNPAKRMRAFEN